MSAPELRRDPLSGRWVIIASERSRRPDEYHSRSSVSANGSSALCPFCSGRERETPPEVEAIRESLAPADQPGWRVRAVPNKFPALIRGHSPKHHRDGLFESKEGVGVHEVVIDSPHHDLEMADLSLSQVRETLETYRSRIRSIETEPQYQYIQLFKNRGREAGATLSHPHAQILATPFIPPRIQEDLCQGERFWRATGDCLFCRILSEEKAAGKRMVLTNAHFTAAVPFAARTPFEIRLHPHRHATHFSGLAEEELTSLAEILAGVLGRIKAAISDPPYNIVLHQAPHPGIAAELWPDFSRFIHWYLEIIPVVTRPAGFEWGTDSFINPVSPEDAASLLR